MTVESREANWKPRLGDIIEYIGTQPHGESNKQGLFGVVTKIWEGDAWHPQIEVCLITGNVSFHSTQVIHGWWAGNCRKVGEVES